VLVETLDREHHLMT